MELSGSGRSLLKVEELTSTIATLGDTIKKLSDEQAELTAAMGKATELRNAEKAGRMRMGLLRMALLQNARRYPTRYTRTHDMLRKPAHRTWLVIVLCERSHPQKQLFPPD